MVIHIAVNALSITSEPSGNRTYLLNLLEELTPLAGDSFYFSLFVSGQKIADEFSSRISPHNTRCIVFPRQVISPLLRIAVEQLYLPLWIRQNEVDLLFAARNVMPLLTNCITVIGVLSMHLNYDENVIPCWKKFYGKKILEASARRADAYISISEYAGETYVRKYNVSRDRLFVSRLGFRRDAIVVGEEINSNPIASEYLLFVSTLFPHKNASFLLKVFAEVAHKRPATKLVIVGRDFKNAVENLKKKALVLGIADRVDFRGPVSGTELKQLYRHAKVFVFPSLVEGFGLSVLEAMAYGIPVVSSNRTSLPEVVGDAGILLDPTSDKISRWSSVILELLEDHKRYEEYSRRSKNRSNLFTWRQTAKITLNCFEQILRAH